MEKTAQNLTTPYKPIPYNLEEYEIQHFGWEIKN